jgi:hypothetical protein
MGSRKRITMPNHGMYIFWNIYQKRLHQNMGSVRIRRLRIRRMWFLSCRFIVLEISQLSHDRMQPEQREDSRN